MMLRLRSNNDDSRDDAGRQRLPSPPTAEDQELLERFRRGDNNALGRLYDLHHERICLYCVKMIGSWQQTEDIVHEMWERVLRLRGTTMPILNPRGFFFRIARNLCLDQLKRNGRFTPIEDLQESLHPSAGIERSGEAADLVNRCLERLTDDHREVVILHLYCGYRLEEIAEMLGKSHAAIRKRASRAQAQLRSLVVDMQRIEHGSTAGWGPARPEPDGRIAP